jgi:hypothetical protein
VNQETKERIADEEEDYFERRLEELEKAGIYMSRSDMYARINRELDEIKANRNAP